MSPCCERDRARRRNMSTCLAADHISSIHLHLHTMLLLVLLAVQQQQQRACDGDSIHGHRK